MAPALACPCGGRRQSGQPCDRCGRGGKASRLESQRASDANRGNFRQRGYDARWDKAKKVWLAEHPLCVLCDKQGLVVAAYCVDHIVPHKGNMDLFWVYDNWQSLCRSCHARKSASERGQHNHA